MKITMAVLIALAGISDVAAATAAMITITTTTTPTPTVATTINSFSLTNL